VKHEQTQVSPARPGEGCEEERKGKKGDEVVLTVTEGARQNLKETLLSFTDNREMGLRLSMTEPGRFGLALDKEREGDQVVEHEGLNVLFIGLDMVDALQGTTIDVRDAPDGPQLVISRR